MRIFLKPLLLALLTAFPALAQIPAPQINLTGSIGCQGFPCVNTGTLNLTADANYNLVAVETSAFYMKVTSSVSLTATRNLIWPAGRFPVGVENATTGGQIINVCGPSGSCVPIPNSTATMTLVWNDGTNFVASATGSGINQLSGDVTAGPGSGNQATTLATVNTNTGPCGDATHVAVVTLNLKGLTTGCTPVAITGVASGVSGQASGVVPLGSTSTTIGAQSHINENTSGITTVTQPLGATAILAGTPSSAAKAAIPSGAHGFASDESTTSGVPAAGVDYIRADATAHCYEYSVNGGAEACLGVASGTVTDGSGSTTVNQLAVATGTAHVLSYVTALPAAAEPAHTGDMTNTAGSLATTVGKINGTAFPTSAALVGSNGSAQPTAVTAGTGVITALGVNTGTAGAFGVLIASGTSALGTGAISSATCATVVTTTATGVAATDAIIWNPNGSIKAVTGYVPSTSGGLTIAAYPTSGNVNFDVCNWTSSSITPGAVTLNWRVVR